MKHKKPLLLKLEIDGYQEDQIVAASIAESFRRIKSTKDPHELPEGMGGLKRALKCVYHYYTGKLLK